LSIPAALFPVLLVVNQSQLFEREVLICVHRGYRLEFVDLISGSIGILLRELRELDLAGAIVLCRRRGTETAETGAACRAAAEAS
jgi:hypothetical protein